MAQLNVQQTATWLSRSSALILTPMAHSQPARSPSTSSARVCWVAAMMISLHQLSKDFLSRCYHNSARICWVWISLQYEYNRGTQYKCDWVSSTSSARICWASPNNYCMYSTQTQRMTVESDSQIHSSRIQQKKSLALHTAQGLSRRRWLSLALHTPTAQRLNRRR